MKLNLDCIRDIMLYIEDNQTIDERNNLSNVCLEDLMSLDYTQQDLYYSLKQICDSGLVDFFSVPLLGNAPSYVITDISPYGHEFLQNIHDDTNWNTVKETAKKVGSFSFKTLIDIASSVISSKLSNLI